MLVEYFFWQCHFANPSFYNSELFTDTKEILKQLSNGRLLIKILKCKKIFFSFLAQMSRGNICQCVELCFYSVFWIMTKLVLMTLLEKSPYTCPPFPRWRCRRLWTPSQPSCYLSSDPLPTQKDLTRYGILWVRDLRKSGIHMLVTCITLYHYIYKVLVERSSWDKTAKLFITDRRRFIEKQRKRTDLNSRMASLLSFFRGRKS